MQNYELKDNSSGGMMSLLNNTENDKNTSKTMNKSNRAGDKSTFQELGVESWLCVQCASLAMYKPTRIQQVCIPAILHGHHVAGKAETGSGKTAAFALPILQTLSHDMYGVCALVLTASRELAYQIIDQFVALGAPIRIRTLLAIGGVRHEEQLDGIKSRPHVVVATPGRLRYLFETFSREMTPAFGHLRYLVLDEADRLTDGDMQKDVQELLHLLPRAAHRQVLLFSATLSMKLLTQKTLMENTKTTIENNMANASVTVSSNHDSAIIKTSYSSNTSWLELMGIESSSELHVFEAEEHRNSSSEDNNIKINKTNEKEFDGKNTLENEKALHESNKSVNDSNNNNAYHEIESIKYTLPSTLKHRYIFIPNMVKLPNLVAALRAQGKDQLTIVFTNSALRAELVRLTLQLLGFPVCSLDSLLTQQHRLDNLALFKLGLARIMVCTDISARGLDIPEVELVIHYDVPKHSTTYVHRVGRTARAGRAGLSVAFITEFDVRLIQRIERQVNVKMTQWEERQINEKKVLALLDEVSAAKVEAKQQVTSQFGNRAATHKQQAADKKAQRAEEQKQQHQQKKNNNNYQFKSKLPSRSLNITEIADEEEKNSESESNVHGRHTMTRKKINANSKTKNAKLVPRVGKKANATSNTKAIKSRDKRILIAATKEDDNTRIKSHVTKKHKKNKLK